MYERGPETDEAGHGLERIVYFSDAVFAIAITLLVIDLRLPEFANSTSLTNAQINRVLHDLAPKIFSYVLSFSVIGLYWLAHWRRYQ
jgi:uncharacterized membrane protein